MRLKLFAIVAIVLFACDRRAKLSVEENGEVNVTEDYNLKEVRSDEFAVAGGAAPEARRLIRNGTLEFQTSDWEIAKKQIAFICDSLGAYVADETLNNLSDRITYHQIIRVPSSRFADLVEKIEKVSGGLTDKSITVDDVTEEYMDIEIRMRNKKEMENRYRELLVKASTVTEMLNIEAHISQVRTEIEIMEGKLKHMQNQISLSTLEVTFYEKLGTEYGFPSKLANSFSNGWEILLTVIIGMANIWPFLVLITAVGWWIKRRTSTKVADSNPA